MFCRVRNVLWPISLQQRTVDFGETRQDKGKLPAGAVNWGEVTGCRWEEPKEDGVILVGWFVHIHRSIGSPISG